MIFSGLTVAVCPNRKIGGYIYSIFAAINCAYIIYQVWTVDVDYSGRIITTLIIATIVILITAGHSISVALMLAEDE